MANRELGAAPVAKELQSAVVAFEKETGVKLGQNIALELNKIGGNWKDNEQFNAKLESVVKNNRAETKRTNPDLYDWYTSRAQEKVESMYRQAMGENCDMSRFVQVSVAACRIYQDIGTQPPSLVPGYVATRQLPGKRSETPATQAAQNFRAGLNAAAKTGMSKEELVRSEQAGEVVAGYYQYVKAALYGEFGFPEVKMPKVFGDGLYEKAVPQTIRDKVVLTPDERKSFEAWLGGKAELGHDAWNKVKFAMGVTDPWSHFETGDRQDAQLNAYRTTMAEKGCDVMRLVYRTEEYAQAFLQLASL